MCYLFQVLCETFNTFISKPISLRLVGQNSKEHKKNKNALLIPGESNCKLLKKHIQMNFHMFNRPFPYELSLFFCFFEFSIFCVKVIFGDLSISAEHNLQRIWSCGFWPPGLSTKGPASRHGLGSVRILEISPTPPSYMGAYVREEYWSFKILEIYGHLMQNVLYEMLYQERVLGRRLAIIQYLYD